MSCSVIAIPYALAWVIGSLVVGQIQTAIENNNQDKSNVEYVNIHDELPNICEDVNVISESHFLEKKLETPFMDKTILLKTLEEHGIQNIQECRYADKISGEIDNYSLVFEKSDKTQPYSLTITYSKHSHPESKINDLHTEYALNVQEDVYLNMVEKLKENNLQIEEEEVLDDDTIVLTVNLD